jgi:ribonucleoside-diphosphate reductase alpha chain
MQQAWAWEDVEKYFIMTRYAVRSVDGKEVLESSWDEMVDRFERYYRGRNVRGVIEKEFSGLRNIDDLITKLLQAIRERLIIPATPFLMSFGNEYTRRKGYFSCYPLGCVPDTMEGIYKVCEDMREICIRGGGCGVDVSKLRQRSAAVDNGQGLASGPVGFLPLFDAVTGTTNQGGRRRGALLVQMYWRHPDIVRFIKAKSLVPALSSVICNAPEDEKVDIPLSNMNISVVVDSEFFDEENGELFSVIAEQMWKSGDPGLLFLDNMLKYSPFNYEADERDFPCFSNPCGEYLAPAYTSCNLVTVNVAKIASWCVDGSEFDFGKFYSNVFDIAKLACLHGNILVHLDEGYPLDEIREATQRVRPVGVGMTGFHTALLLAYDGHVRYGKDEESLKFAELTQAVLTLGTLEMSALLAEATGRVYKWNKSYLDLHLEELREAVGSSYRDSFEFVRGVGKRLGGFYNSVTTSQPPTGSVSLFAHVAGDTGIEPIFDIFLRRRVKDFGTGEWREVEIVTEYLLEKLGDKGFRGRVEKQLAHELKPLEQLGIVSSFQRFIHTGVSKTINCPYETSVDEIRELIEKSVWLRLKGFTVFRDGCRSDTVYIKDRGGEGKKGVDELSPVRSGLVYEVRGTVNAYITTTFDDDKNLREVFVTIGKSGTTLNSVSQAFGRVISVALRKYPDLCERFIETLKGIESGEFYSCDGFTSKSIPDAIARVMEDAVMRVKGVERGDCGERVVGDLCPVCGGLSLMRQGNCRTCERCGYSTC